MTWPFKSTPKPTIHDEYHQYTVDLLDLNKLRGQQQQAAIMKKPGAQAEVENYDRLILVAQKTLLRLIDNDAKKNPLHAEKATK